MPIATAVNLGITSPQQLASIPQNQAIAAQKQGELERLGGADSAVGLKNYNNVGYSSNRGILCEKDFYDEPARVLLFQFNPETIQDNKGNNYTTKSYTGFTYNDYPWISGGERVITFELNFIATAGANTPHFGKGRDTSSVYGASTVDTLEKFFPHGTLDDIDILRGFLYPKLTDPEVVRFTKSGHIPTPKFTSPPIVIFSYGAMYLEGYVTDCNIEHTTVNEKLIPVISKANVTFKVIEAYVPTELDVLTDKATGSSVNSLAGSYKQKSYY